MVLVQCDGLLLQRARRAWTARATSAFVASLQTALRAVIVVAVSGACYSGLDARGRREPFFPRILIGSLQTALSAFVLVVPSSNSWGTRVDGLNRHRDMLLIGITAVASIALLRFVGQFPSSVPTGLFSFARDPGTCFATCRAIVSRAFGASFLQEIRARPNTRRARCTRRASL
jgi:hypothetical protein